MLGRVAEKLLDALQRPDHYRGIVEEVRRHLIAHHSYSAPPRRDGAVLQHSTGAIEVIEATSRRYDTHLRLRAR